MGGELEEMEETLQNLFYVMLLAILLIAVILVFQFNSYLQALIILFTLPLALIGVFFGFFLLGWPVTFFSFIGIIGLCGIVVNDAIILIDRANYLRRHGMELREATVEAGVSRLQPIFLTTLTTIFGLLPLGIFNEMWRSLAFAIIFGIAFATVLTLLIVPVMYVSVERWKEKRREKKAS